MAGSSRFSLGATRQGVACICLSVLAAAAAIGLFLWLGGLAVQPVREGRNAAAWPVLFIGLSSCVVMFSVALGAFLLRERADEAATGGGRRTVSRTRSWVLMIFTPGFWVSVVFFILPFLSGWWPPLWSQYVGEAAPAAPALLIPLSALGVYAGGVSRRIGNAWPLLGFGVGAVVQSGWGVLFLGHTIASVAGWLLIWPMCSLAGIVLTLRLSVRRPVRLR
jgi:hypothetical protein